MAGIDSGISHSIFRFLLSSKDSPSSLNSDAFEDFGEILLLRYSRAFSNCGCRVIGFVSLVCYIYWWPCSIHAPIWLRIMEVDGKGAGEAQLHNCQDALENLGKTNCRRGQDTHHRRRNAGQRPTMGLAWSHHASDQHLSQFLATYPA